MSHFTISHLAINNPAKTGQKRGVKVLLSNPDTDKVAEQVDKGLDKIGENAAEGEGKAEGEGLKPDAVSQRNEVTIVDERDKRTFDRASILNRLASNGIYTTSKNVSAKPGRGLEESKMGENVGEAKRSVFFDSQITLADSIVPPSIEFTKPITEKSTIEPSAVKPGPIIKRRPRKPKVPIDGEEEEDKPKAKKIIRRPEDLIRGN